MEQIHEMEPQQNTNARHHVDHVPRLQERCSSQSHGEQYGELEAEPEDEDDSEEKRLLRRHLFPHTAYKPNQKGNHYENTGDSVP